ncbi:hypothetical protein ACWD4J_40655 [Streptomyces sp. NPDC002577]
MRKFPVLALALLGTAFPVTPADAAANTLCNQDGVAELCVTAETVNDVVGLNYDVEQQDGPGSYQISYVDLNNGFTSATQDVGPLRYQRHGFGTLFGELGHCFRVILTSTAGTTLTAQPLCA